MFFFSFLVSVPPVIVDFNQTAMVTAGRELVLPCYVNGDPTPTIQWLKGISLDIRGLFVWK